MNTVLIATPAVLRKPQVLAFTGLSRSTLYELIAAEAFPRPVPLGPRAVGWLADEVTAWLAERVKQRAQIHRCR